MTLLFDKPRSIASPALAPIGGNEQGAHRSPLNIALINNMPDSALKATERQFQRLIQVASGDSQVRLHCYSLPSIIRSGPAKKHVDAEYGDIADLGGLWIDGLIVTGAEPIAGTLQEEPYWHELIRIIEWAKTNTRSAIWSCLAAHAAVLHLDGIERHRLETKCSGIYDCACASYDWLTNGAPAVLQVAHSRHNALRESDLAARGYQILTRSKGAGVDMFVKNYQSRFIFFQGHPEYDALSLQREYMRDVARFLAGERPDYPRIPLNYFDVATEDILRRFEAKALTLHEPTLAAELPGLMLRPNDAAGAAAAILFRNWISFLTRRDGRGGRPADVPTAPATVT